MGSEIGIHTMRKFFKMLGAKRVSDDAAYELAKYVEKEIGIVVKKAEEIARHARRVTITEEDVRLACKLLKK